jgi:hypothetical protein
LQRFGLQVSGHSTCPHFELTGVFEFPFEDGAFGGERKCSFFSAAPHCCISAAFLPQRRVLRPTRARSLQSRRLPRARRQQRQAQRLLQRGQSPSLSASHSQRCCRWTGVAVRPVRCRVAAPVSRTGERGLALNSGGADSSGGCNRAQPPFWLASRALGRLSERAGRFLRTKRQHSVCQGCRTLLISAQGSKFKHNASSRAQTASTSGIRSDSRHRGACLTMTMSQTSSTARTTALTRFSSAAVGWRR